MYSSIYSLIVGLLRDILLKPNAGHAQTGSVRNDQTVRVITELKQTSLLGQSCNRHIHTCHVQTDCVSSKRLKPREYGDMHLNPLNPINIRQGSLIHAQYIQLDCWWLNGRIFSWSLNY